MKRLFPCLQANKRLQIYLATFLPCVAAVYIIKLLRIVLLLKEVGNMLLLNLNINFANFIIIISLSFNTEQSEYSEQWR